MFLKIFLCVILCSVGISVVRGQRCSAGWYGFSLQSKCYRFVYKNQMTWQDARDFCQIHGGDLLKIDSAREQNWVFQQIRRLQNRTHTPTTHWWVGLNNREFITKWEWADGSPVGNFIHWKPGEPNNMNGVERCGEVWNINQYNDESCDTKFKFICYRNRGIPLKCDADNNWQSLNGACYKVYTARKNWNAAQGQCDHDGGDIVTIDSVNEEIAVHDFALSYHQALWIGLHTVKLGSQPVQWQWANGTAVTTTYWHGNPPRVNSNQRNNTCAQITYAQPVKSDWSASTCTGVSRSFVCRKPEGVCLPGWIGHQRYCWQFNFQYRLNFNAAANFCKQQGAMLLAIKSGSDQLFLRGYLDELRDSGVTSFWIGASDDNHDGTYKWRDNTPIQRYKQWAAAHNNPGNTRNRTDCVYINTNDQAARWRTTPSCQGARPFICMIPMGANVTTVTTPRPRYGCPANWQLYQQYCFRVGDRALDFVTARKACQQTQGADLAKITSAGMQGLVNRLAKQGINYWIGLNDRTTDTVYVWSSDNTALTGYKNWKPGQPNNFHHQENCVVNTNGQWNDVVCSSRNQYICSMTAGSPLGTMPPTTPMTDWTIKCGPGWESNPASDNCYMLVDEPLSWLDALNQCTNYQGNLVAIETLQEQNYLAGRLKTMNSLAVWTGANDRATEGGWKWSNQMPFAYFNWAPGQPSSQQQGQGQDCVAMFTQSALWDDVDCTTRNGYICEKKGNVPQTTVPTTPTVKVPAGMVLGCGQGWLPFRNSCYRIIPRPGPYTTAQTMCGRMGSKLASILDRTENSFIAGNLPKGQHSWDGFWIGLNDIQLENRFIWTDGQTVTYTNWNTNEPNNYRNRNEDCVGILLNNAKWNDYVCTDSAPGFVCKAPKRPVSATQAPWQQGCPQYSQGVGAYCFRPVTQGQNWDAANAFCNSSYHGFLAVINDRIMEAFLSSQLYRYGSRNFWIGLTDKFSPGTYKWVTNDTVQYTNWYNTHTGNERSTCVIMRGQRPSGLWENQDCSTQNAFICQFPRTGYTPTTTPTPWPNVACPTNWTANQGVCLKAFSDQSTVKTWMEAVAYCQSVGGDLPSFHTNSNDSVLQTMLSQYHGQAFWIGLNDRDQEGGHKWSDGSAVDYTNWNPGEPNDFKGYEDCVTYMVDTNGWNDQNCYFASRFVCSVPRGTSMAAVTVPPTGAPSATCGNDPNWLLYNGNCYYLSPDSGDNSSLSWYDANTYCTSMQSNLVSMHSQDEHSFLLTLITRRSSNFYSYWTGLNILNGDSYQWTDQTPVDFEFWLPNQPDDYLGSERCMEMKRAFGYWNDEHCSVPKSFICKKPQTGSAVIATPAPYPAGGCAQGFTRAPGGRNKCFYMAGAQQNSRLNWTMAYQMCRRFGKGYDIASIEDIFEQKFLITMAQGRTDPLWIGLSDLRGNNHFFWQNNVPLTYTNWDRGEPTSSHQSSHLQNIQNCVLMRLNSGHEGRWSDANCNLNLGYVCQSQQDPNLPQLGPPQGSCKAGYQWFVNSCYKLVTTPKSWNDAQAACQNDGGNLVSLTSAQESAFVFILVNGSFPVWIGLSDSQIRGLYAWSDGWPVMYSYWGWKEPSYGLTNMTGCVLANSRGRWNDTDCTRQLNYVCKISTVKPPKATPPPVGSCQDPTWIPHGDFCYSVSISTGRSWPESNYICDNQGQKLASVHSQQELDFIVTLVRQAKTNDQTFRPNVWIGLSQGGQGSYQWSDGTPVDFIKWRVGEPTKIGRNGQIENCVELDRDNATYNDIDCFTNKGFVCKSPLVVSTTVGPTGQGQSQGQGPGRPTGNNVLPTYKIQTDSSGAVVGQGSSNLPQVTYPNGQRVTDASGNPVTLRQQNGNTPIVQMSTSNLGLSSGGIVGVVFGCIIVIVLVAFLILYLKRKGKINPPFVVESLGFENATYNRQDEKANINLDSDA